MASGGVADETTPTTQAMYSHVIDAATGRVLYRQSLTDNDSGKAWDYYPGAAKGSTQKTRNFTAPGGCRRIRPTSVATSPTCTAT